MLPHLPTLSHPPTDLPNSPLTQDPVSSHCHGYPLPVPPPRYLQYNPPSFAPYNHPRLLVPHWSPPPTHTPTSSPPPTPTHTHPRPDN
ncbi:hypothetical protein EX30DRAFT_45674 [Ascodesmis nigricans]|uniref:Uncharacterized protein n=1 Tax=Ascodesmis nigricans TaxID=341454 RepID=A0A4S2MWL3_9PEZI|nr:hypothetical protein EX30DRAFT_45674 [Ascodesmis nigricans]